MKVKKIGLLTSITLALFFLSHGQASAETFAGLVDKVTGSLASSIIKFIFALAFIYFFWGVAQYALYPDDENKKDKGRQFMLWGIIGLTVMFSVYGLINLVSNTLLK